MSTIFVMHIVRREVCRRGGAAPGECETDVGDRMGCLSSRT